ncbi:presequence protease, mitochondrial [Diutina catenulata]
MLKAYRFTQSTRQLATSAYKVGTVSHGFTVQQVQSVPEYSLVAVHLRHSSGAEHLHLNAPQDSNNVFSIGFKTNPPDSTGLPHILEHTTLCGSKRFPVRDPFFKMTNRSLANFMNAMTGHDYTFYPFATTNHQDFANLMEVYLSSVFEPTLAETDFLQEGWRLEFEEVDDASSNLTFKGVVYNEMKGQNSNSAYYFYSKYLEHIYPSLHNSGGDPSAMTSLNYSELLQFHREHYHPANAKTFTYGSMGLEMHLPRLNRYLTEFCRPIEDTQGIMDSGPKDYVKNFDQRVEVDGPPDPMCGHAIDHQFKASVTWKLADNALDEHQRVRIFRWKILGSLLCDGHNSPLYQELIEKGIGSDFTANTGVDVTTKLFGLTLGLTNLSRSEADDIERSIKRVIQRFVVPAFENEDAGYRDRVEAILAQLELNLKKHKPEFGLGLLSSLIPHWMNGVDPVKAVAVEEVLSAFKTEWAATGLKGFAELLRAEVLGPVPSFTFVMSANANFSEDLIRDEESKLASKVNALDAHDRERIFARGKELAAVQAAPQDPDVLPTLTLADIPEESEVHPVTTSTLGDSTMSTRIVDTNGLVYAAAVKDISFLTPDLYKWLPLYSSCLLNLAGTSSTPITTLETLIQKYTGGVSFGARVAADPNDTSQAGLQWSVSGMSLAPQGHHVFELWNEIQRCTRFEGDEVETKLETLIKNLAQNQVNVIADRGHSYASGLAAASVSQQKFLSYEMTGLGQVKFVMDLNRRLQQRGRDYLKSDVLPTLRKLQKTINDTNRYRYRLVGDSETVGMADKWALKYDDANTPIDHVRSALPKWISSPQNTWVDLPYPVGYAALSLPGAAYTSFDGAALQVLAQILSFKYLHSVIRESNGAYGGGMSFDGLSGVVSYYSYRDPNPIKSIASFKQSAIWGRDYSFSDRDLQEAKLRLFQSVDAPTNIASQGSSEFYDGVTDDMRQQRRQHFMSVANTDLHHVIERYLLDVQNSKTIIGEAKSATLPKGWNVHKLHEEV